MAKTYTEDDLQKYGVGLNELNVGFAFHTGAPLDDRTVVNTKAALISDNKKGFKDADNKKTWIYPGMTVTVVDPGDIYVLTNYEGLKFYTLQLINLLEMADKLDTEIAKYWTKLPSQDDLQKALDANKKELFTFKGVASAIDEDRCTITVGYATVKDGDDSKFTIKQQAYDILKETMYGWGSESNKNVFWTHESTGTELPVYTRGGLKDVTCLMYQGDVYYRESTNVYESLDGDFLYQSGDKYYFDEKYQQEATGVKTETYHGYEFTKVANTKLLLETPEDGGQTANSDNIGHVYQIGEEEYASNGSIWVQLGSPKEDWIVIK